MNEEQVNDEGERGASLMEAGVTAGSPVGTAVADIKQTSVLDRAAYPVTAAVSSSRSRSESTYSTVSPPPSPSSAGFSGVPSEHILAFCVNL